jgi:DNA-binding CsgD family transcriptional regulator
MFTSVLLSVLYTGVPKADIDVRCDFRPSRRDKDGEFMIRPDSRSHPAVASLSEVNLTQRQIEVLRLLACGLTATAVARSLGISTHTVNGHLREMFRRSEVPNAVALIAHAYAGGVLAGWPPSVHGWAPADAGKPWLSGRSD